MEVWALIVIIVLFIVIVALGIFFGITTKNNYDLSAQQRLYPFAAVIDPQNPNQVVPLNNEAGESQLTCPPGTKINIVGAFFDIVDPYGMCTPNPTSVVSATCGGPGTIICPANACPANMSCEPSQTQGDNNSYCVASPCNASTVLPPNTSTTTWTCNPNPAFPLTPAQQTAPLNFTGRITPVEVCSNLNGSFQNTTCANGANNCAPRDASAYLAKACDGQQVCNATISSQYFGPFPCGGTNFQNPGNMTTPGSCSSNQTASSGYCSLPYAPGTDPSFTPANAANPAGTTFSQGYMVHGLYTCVPK